MFNSIGRFNPYFKIQNLTYNNVGGLRINQLQHDTVSFKGASPADYKTSFDYMVSQSEAFKKEPYSSNKRPSDISKTVEQYLQKEKYNIPVETSKENNTFCSSYNEELKDEIVKAINETRKLSFQEWNDFIENTDNDCENEVLRKKIQSNPSLKLVIWQALAYDLSENNRHIPLPLDFDVLSDTISYFENMDKLDKNIKAEKKELNVFRNNNAQSPKSFNDVYSSKLIENTLISIIENDNNKKENGIKLLNNQGILIQEPTREILEKNEGLWVVIPAKKKNNNKKNVEIVENLSNKNWCTRSEADKASAALEDGDFYIYLGKDDDKFIPQIGITSANGKLVKVQGEANNNTLDLKYFDILEDLLINTNSITPDGKNIKCATSRDPEGLNLYGYYLVLKELKENPELLIAIKQKDYQSFLQHLKGVDFVSKNENGMLHIKNYNSVINFNNRETVALSDFGIDEIDLLKNIQIVDGKVNTTSSPNENIPKVNSKSLGSGENLYQILLSNRK